MRAVNRRTHPRAHAMGVVLGVWLILCLAVAPGAPVASADEPSTGIAPYVDADRSPGDVTGVSVDTSASANGDGSTPPQFRVTVDNGVGTVATGDTLTYSVTVQNLGTAVAGNLLVTQTIPPTLEYVLADPGGTAASGRVSWDLDLKPNEIATFRTVMAVLTPPSDLDSVATSVCVATAVDAPPQVCATDTDQLLGAAVTDSTAAGTAEPVAGESLWWSISPAFAVVTIIMVAVVLLVRRRRRPKAG